MIRLVDRSPGELRGRPPCNKAFSRQVEGGHYAFKGKVIDQAKDTGGIISAGVKISGGGGDRQDNQGDDC